jgi:cyclopropane fatty-acyl-phospholipid synthase-like methyltransferase
VLEFLARSRSRFDLVVALDLVEHLRKDEVLEFLDLCREALRARGRLVLQNPNGGSPWCGSNVHGDFTHETCFTPSSLRGLLLLAGFSDVKAREQGVVVRGGASAVRWVAWRLLVRFCWPGTSSRPPRGVPGS